MLLDLMKYQRISSRIQNTRLIIIPRFLMFMISYIEKEKKHFSITWTRKALYQM